MVIKRARFTSVRFHDVDGFKREIKGLRLSDRRRFLALYELLLEVISEYPSDCDWRSLYDEFDGSTEFRESVDEILSLFGLSPEWISARMLGVLLFAHEGSEGLLFQLEFPPKPKTGKPLPEDSDPYAEAIAGLWSFMPEQGLEEVLASADSMPWNDLEQVLDARTRQLEEAHPDLKKKREQKEQQLELAQEFAEELRSGKFADEVPPVRGTLAKAMGGGRNGARR